MIIAIIGSPLSGKTTLLKKISEKGVKVFHTDSFVTKIYKKDEEGYQIIAKEFGTKYVNNIEVDRKKLAEFVSVDDNLARLNEIIHPLIFKYLEGKDNFITELPILSNSPINFNFDKIVLVKADREKIIERFGNTNLKNPKFVEKIIGDWNNETTFDYVVDTTNDIKESDISNIITMLNEK